MQENIIEALHSIRQLLVDQVIVKKEVLSLQEASQYLDLSTSQLYKLTSSKQLPHSCPGGKKVYFKRSELDAWALSGKRASIAEIDSLATNYILTKSKAKGGVTC